MLQRAETESPIERVEPQDHSLFPALRKEVEQDRRGVAKHYVLDTNVLLHDPHSIYRFENNHVHIPIEVLSELDKFKNEQTERGANARAVHRMLTQAFNGNAKLVQRGVKTPGGGTIRIVVGELYTRSKPGRVMQKFKRVFPDMERMDHRIMACCVAMGELTAEPTVLVTKDLNMQLKALAIGLEAQDYLNDKVEVRDVEESETRLIEVEPHELQRFGSARTLVLEGKRSGGLVRNEYVVLCAGEGKHLPARFVGENTFHRLRVPPQIDIPRGIQLRPANLGQQCFLDALLDPDISLVTCYGQAGTGKTLLAVAAGISQVFDGQFVGLTVSRPVVAMGDTLGFLPGTLNEKMHPWLQSIYDAFDVLMPTAHPGGGESRAGRKAGRRKQGGEASPLDLQGNAPKIVKAHELLTERGLLEIEALCYIRGRSIPNRFFVLDEAQQLTPLEAKTVVTRMSKGSKLVMVGDPGQIDNPYVDSRSNGLVYTRNRLKGKGITAHVCLMKGERSALAEMGATLM